LGVRSQAVGDARERGLCAAYGSYAVITGGSEGVGSAWATALAQRGLNLVLVALRTDVLNDKAAELRSLIGRDVRTLSIDLTSTGAVKRIVTETAGLEVGLIIHNAGAVSRHHGRFVDDPPDTLTSLIQLNCAVPTELVHAFAPLMSDRGQGGVVLIGSLSGVAGQALEAVYSAAKSFSQTFAEAMWRELGERGVDVVSVPLGGTRTPNLTAQGLLGADALPTPEEVVEESIEHLSDGPVFVPRDANRRFFEKVSRLPRRDGAETTARLAYRVAGNPET
jgi:short-subunit dehydrogenase